MKIEFIKAVEKVKEGTEEGKKRVIGKFTIPHSNYYYGITTDLTTYFREYGYYGIETDITRKLVQARFFYPDLYDRCIHYVVNTTTIDKYLKPIIEDRGIYKQHQSSTHYIYPVEWQEATKKYLHKKGIDYQYSITKEKVGWFKTKETLDVKAEIYGTPK